MDKTAEAEDRSYGTATLRGGLRHNLARYVQRVSGGQSWTRYLWQGTVLTLLSGLPMPLGWAARATAYRTVLGGMGRGCIIERNVRLSVPRRIFLGEEVAIGEGCLLDANTPQGRIELGDGVRLGRECYVVVGRGEVVIGATSQIFHRCLMYGTRSIQIGRGVLLANDVQLICGNHTFARRDIPIRAQAVDGAPITIEDDVCLGASAIVLGGVTVGRGAVVGAGAVVTRSLPPYSISWGVPARVVGVRGDE